MAKLDVKAFGLAFGIVWGICTLGLGLMALIVDWGTGLVNALGTLYLGYQPTFFGSLIGGLWGFVDAFVGGIIIGHWLGPRRRDPIKDATYESGLETIGDTWIQFRAQYYLLGLIFLIFDVEVIFLFPIALAFDRLSLFSVLIAMTFVLILLLGLAVEWRKGGLEWE